VKNQETRNDFKKVTDNAANTGNRFDDGRVRGNKKNSKYTRRTKRLVLFGCVGLATWLLGKYLIREDAERSVSSKKIG
jgi:hypothetical protein